MSEAKARIVGVLLAAGRGERFGGHKLLAPLPDGTAVAVAAARNLDDALPDSVAVLRPGTSLARGIAASDADGWVIALADMPAIQPATVKAVAAALAAGAPLVAPVYRGQRGHPIGFARRFRDALTALTGDRGGRDILAQHAQDLRLIDVDDPGVLLDIDRAVDLEKTVR